MAFTVSNKTMADYPHLLIRSRVTCDTTDTTTTAAALDHGGPTDVTPLHVSIVPVTKIATATTVEVNYDETNGEMDVRLNHSSGNGFIFDVYTTWPSNVSADGESLDNFP